MEERKRVALVTGAGAGIGRAIALRLAKDGFHVAVNDINLERAAEVVEEVQSLGAAGMMAPADVSNRKQVFDMVEQVSDAFGSLDVMVSNAGINIVKPILEITEENLKTIFGINVFGVLYGLQAAAEQMIKQKTGGKIINASSAGGKRGFKLLGQYSATKFAVVGITQTAALEFAEHGITVNAYCPGAVDTNMWENIDEVLGSYLGLQKGEALKKRVEIVPMGRVGKPQDVANLVAFLASRDSDYMTGQSLVVDGGVILS